MLTIIYIQNSPEEEAELKKLKDIEKSVEQTAKKLEKVDGELTGLKNVRIWVWRCKCIWIGLFQIESSTITHLFFPQGFLAKDLQAEALGKLDHRVKIASEQFMKILEQIDALVIPFGGCVYWSASSMHMSWVTYAFFPESSRKLQWLQNQEKGPCEDCAGKAFLSARFSLGMLRKIIKHDSFSSIGFPGSVWQDRGLYIRSPIKDSVEEPCPAGVEPSLVSCANHCSVSNYKLYRKLCGVPPCLFIVDVMGERDLIREHSDLEVSYLLWSQVHHCHLINNWIQKIMNAPLAFYWTFESRQQANAFC